VRAGVAVSDYHRAVTCEKCGKNNLKVVAPLRLHFQPHAQCQNCGHEELEILTFMRCCPAMMEDRKTSKKSKASAKREAA
jgi:hypothetical protein